GAMVTSDIDRLTPRTEELVASVTHAIFAQHVPTNLTGLNDMERALRKLRLSHAHVLVVTMGEHGAVALEGGRFFHEPACEVQAGERGGGGGVVGGGFSYARPQKQRVAGAPGPETAAAAVSCPRLGALNGVPTLDEVRTLVSANAEP